ncbi:MAG: DUF4296 domain-containing protein [Balneolales bacterium]
MPFILLFGIACSTPEENTGKLIEEDIYIDLLTELHLLSAIEDTYPDSTLREDGLDSILNYYNITVETFEESHEHYLQDEEAQRARLDEANRRLEDEHERINDVTFKVQEERRQAQKEEREMKENS